MRWILLSLFLIAATPVHDLHDESFKVDQEFENVYDNLQDKSFRTITVTTPAFENMRDGEITIYKSTTAIPQDIRLMLRVGTTVYVSPNFTIMRGR